MERQHRDMWELAEEYMPAFCAEWHWVPDQVYDQPWSALVRLSLVLDDIIVAKQEQAAANAAASQG